MYKLINPDEIYEDAKSLGDTMRTIHTHMKIAEQMLEDYNREQTDILHRMENTRCLHSERSRLATKLSVIRRERRQVKDWIRALKPVYDYVGKWDESQPTKQISNLCGLSRKAKENLERIENMKE